MATSSRRRTLVEVQIASGIQADINDDGSGSWVLFLHSRYVNKSIWSEIMPWIPRGSVCAFNQRGFNLGDQDPPQPERSLESVTAVFEALQPKQAVLVGTSLGAGLALAACTDKHLPIVGAVLAGFLVPTLANAAVAARYDQGSVTERTFGGAGASSGVVARFLALSESVPRAAREFAVDDFWKYLVKFPYQNIGVPLLFITGRDDNLMPPHLVRDSLRRLPTAENVVLENVAHGVISQAPEQFLGKLLDFLARIGFPDRSAEHG